jgi:hypothetical protein
MCSRMHRWAALGQGLWTIRGQDLGASALVSPGISEVPVSRRSATPQGAEAAWGVLPLHLARVLPRRLVSHCQRFGRGCAGWRYGARTAARHERSPAPKPPSARPQRRMKTWTIPRDCRLKRVGVHHAMNGIPSLHNLALTGRMGVC